MGRPYILVSLFSIPLSHLRWWTALKNIFIHNVTVNCTAVPSFLIIKGFVLNMLSVNFLTWLPSKCQVTFVLYAAGLKSTSQSSSLKPHISGKFVHDWYFIYLKCIGHFLVHLQLKRALYTQLSGWRCLLIREQANLKKLEIILTVNLPFPYDCI